MPYKNIEEQRKAQREWARRNRAKQYSYKVKYKKENPDYWKPKSEKAKTNRILRNRKYRAAHLDEERERKIKYVKNNKAMVLEKERANKYRKRWKEWAEVRFLTNMLSRGLKHERTKTETDIEELAGRIMGYITKSKARKNGS